MQQSVLPFASEKKILHNTSRFITECVGSFLGNVKFITQCCNSYYSLRRYYKISMYTPNISNGATVCTCVGVFFKLIRACSICDTNLLDNVLLNYTHILTGNHKVDVWRNEIPVSKRYSLKIDQYKIVMEMYAIHTLKDDMAEQSVTHSVHVTFSVENVG